MFERLSTGWELSKQSFRVLRLDKELLIFPLLSGVACLLVLASFALPLWDSSYVRMIQDEQQAPDDPLAYVILFAFYFANYFTIVFFNAALIACAIIRFNGGDPTLADGFRAAFSRLPQILGWALVSATVGLILNVIESRSEKAGRFVSGLLGMAWSAASYFVVPVLVVERVGPVQALKRSFAILRKTWGEAIGANIGIGVVMFVAGILAMIPAGIGVYLGLVAGSAAMLVAGIVITVLLFVIISLVSSAVKAIIIGALYEYAARDSVPDQFDESLLRNAFTVR